MRETRRALAALLALGGGAAGCSLLSLDNLAEDGGGGASASSAVASSSSASAGSGSATVSSVSVGTGGAGGGGEGGGCAGCVDGEGQCQVGDLPDMCGGAGDPCVQCPSPRDPCRAAACAAGSCAETATVDGAPCEGGACLDGACVLGAEDCLNGVDDDEDEAVDCSDAECKAFQCSQLTVPSFIGPFLTLFASVEVACPLGLAAVDTRFTSPEGDCKCGDPLFDPCRASVALSSSTCDRLGASVIVSDDCEALPVEAAFGVASSSTSQICTVAAEVEDPGTTAATLCELEGGGCEAGAVCVPPLRAVSGVEHRVCVLHEGPIAQCPEAFPERRVAGPSDDVTCECDCAVDPNTCGGFIDVYTDPLCSTCDGANAACATVSVPSASCAAVSAPGAAPFARLETLSNGDARVAPGAIELVGSQSVLCCRSADSP